MFVAFSYFVQSFKLEHAHLHIFLQLFLPLAKTENMRAKWILPFISLHGYILTEIQPFQHTDGSYKEAETLAHKKLNLFSICLNMHECHFFKCSSV